MTYISKQDRQQEDDCKIRQYDLLHADPRASVYIFPDKDWQ